ncbi:MAG: hypothetical protein PHX27_04040 [Candidatus ainarchaeum sp.]|nr:hypothetical protein [Candidatus ainarchaeum sp.]
MIESIKEINDLFEEIDSKIDSMASVFVIGGGALMFHKLKSLTKDIDLVVRTKKEYETLSSALKKLGFNETTLTKGGKRLNVSSVLEKGDARIDLFKDKVCGKMVFSEKMVERSEKIFGGKKLSVFFSSIEDIFVFKSITDREGDKIDCEEIIKQKPDWKIILEEIKEQSVRGEDVWITYINERLVEFEEKGYKIPIVKETEKLTNEFYKKLKKNFKK